MIGSGAGALHTFRIRHKKNMQSRWWRCGGPLITWCGLADCVQDFVDGDGDDDASTDSNEWSEESEINDISPLDKYIPVFPDLNGFNSEESTMTKRNSFGFQPGDNTIETWISAQDQEELCRQLDTSADTLIVWLSTMWKMADGYLMEWEGTFDDSTIVEIMLDWKMLLRYLVGYQHLMNHAPELPVDRQLHEIMEKWWETVLWRVNEQPHRITLEETDSVASICYVNGYDQRGRPIIYMKHCSESLDYNLCVKRIICIMEYAMKLMGPHVHDTLLIMDFSQYTTRSLPPHQITRHALDILSKHYPETLYRCYMVNTPWIFSIAWKVIQPLIHPLTRAKICFVDDTQMKMIPRWRLREEYIDIESKSTVRKTKRKTMVPNTDGNPLLELVKPELLERDFGGLMNFEFEKDVYAKRLLERCGELG